MTIGDGSGSAKIRVMIVDDMRSFRDLLADVLTLEPDIEIAGQAPSGHAALMKLPEINPDCVILDIQMPGMDGLKTLRAIKAARPETGVLICSAISASSVDVALEALASGAIDFVSKAPKLATGDSLIGRLRDEIVPRLRAFKTYGHAAKTKLDTAAREADDLRTAAVSRRDIIAVGVSTGGPAALRVLLPNLAVDTKATVLVVQHMPPLFTRRLAEQLDQDSGLRVKEAENGETAEYGTVYIAPGDYHLELRKRGESPLLFLTTGAPENSVRPSVDVLFRSVASAFGQRAVGVVLTGMGSDGYQGSQVLKARGGIIIAQDQSTSLIYGMPRYVAESGVADKVCALPDIPRVLMRLAGRTSA